MTRKPWTPGQLLRLETKRFVLRSMTPEDVNEEYITWWNDPRVQEGLNMPQRNWQRAHAVNHVQRFNNVDSFHLGVFRKESRELVGFVAIFNNSKLATALMNIVIGNKRYWGRRVPIELSQIVFPFTFQFLGAAKIKSEVVGQNRASLEMCKRLGFQEEGVLRQEKPSFQGGRVDIHLFGLLAEEWYAANKTSNT